ncbi:MAG: TonB-dependent receptor [Arachidicoccus sp.]|nr:TonB-dependent receptor [Arachidicoccus sp.]
MKKLILLTGIILPILLHAQLNGSAILSGKIVNENNEGIPNASINIKGGKKGTIADSAGKFSLVINQKLPFTIVISSIGFTPQEITIKNYTDNLSVKLQSQTYIANEVVVTASRKEEKLMQSPVAIEKLSLKALKESPAPDFYSGLANVKGVQMITSSIAFQVPNTRGFNNPNNFRFVQLDDGIDIQSATLGVPLGNAIGPTELDIESVEITPGAASALYGANAINGLSNLITKNPFQYQGLSIYAKGGINHISETGFNTKALGEFALRYAKAFNNKFAFKVNVGYFRATDWASYSRNDQNTAANPGFPEFTPGENNPAWDAWNKYGDESNNNVTVKLGNDPLIPQEFRSKQFAVRRTGYWETDLTDPVSTNIKADASLNYRINPNTELSYSYRYGRLDGTFQRGNKIRLDNAHVQNHKIELKGRDFDIKAYASLENTGNSYNIKPLADNLDLDHLSNSAWGQKYGAALAQQLENGADIIAANQAARAAADAGRVEPGTPAFKALKNTIIHINDWDNPNMSPVPAHAPATGGAWLHQMSTTYNVDGQWDLTRYVKVVDVLVGADFREYVIKPDGNNFVDFSRPDSVRNLPVSVNGVVPDSSDFGKNVLYKKYGAFIQGTKTFLDEKLKLTASLRVDRNPYFPTKFNPRVAAVYTLAKNHNFRISFQNGYRFPSLFEAVSFVNNGGVRRVGGLPFIANGLGYLDNSYTLSSITKFNTKVNQDVNADPTLTQNQAALNNKNLLVPTALSPTKPEHINSFEFGYKSSLLENKLFIDFDAYSNVYDGFLGQVDVYVPEKNTIKIGTDQAVLDMLSTNSAKQTRYRVYTNAKNKYNSYGSSLGVSYNFYRSYTLSGNINYNNISNNKNTDVFVTGFNTPKWATNLSFGNREVVRNLGFNIVWHWQTSYLWQSPLANGTVPAAQNIDAQVSLRVPAYKAVIKLGGTDLLNHKYIQYAAGPTLSALYYISFTFDGLLSK